MLTDHAGLTRTERLLSLFTRLRPGEGRSTLLFALHVFLLLFAYYTVKALREAFMLTQFTAEVRAYAVAVIALLLMAIVPLYGVVRRRLDGARLLRAITLFFAANLLVFAAIAAAGIRAGFAFFVWVSIFGVMMIAQFWAYAADTFNLKSGQRLFPIIMLGANVGALAGAKSAQFALGVLSPAGLVLAATGVLLATLWLAGPERSGVPEGSRAVATEHHGPPPRLLGGLGLVLRERYLFMIAMLIVLLNWINSTGEFILADVVTRNVDARIAASAGMLDKTQLIAAFYGDYQFWVTLVGLAIQLFLVARIYRWFGIRGALLVLPVISAIAYGLIVFLPVFSMIRLAKIAENSANYSLMNTTNQALYLPVSRDAKYEGKTAIDTFFVRFGDLIQAGVVYAGLNWADWGAAQFAMLNFLLALLWIGLAVAIGREFRRMAQESAINVAPEVAAPIPDLHVEPGRSFVHAVAVDAFSDADPGDVLRLSARLAGGAPLPVWLRFDPRSRAFTGTAPAGDFEEFVVEVVASDVDGLEAASCFVLRRRSAIVG